MNMKKKHHMRHQQLQMLQQSKIKLIRELMTLYMWRVNLIKSTWSYLTKKADHSDKLFDDIRDEPDRRQEIDDIKTENIFIDDNTFSDTGTKDNSNLIDKIKPDIDMNDILF